MRKLGKTSTNRQSTQLLRARTLEVIRLEFDSSPLYFSPFCIIEIEYLLNSLSDTDFAKICLLNIW
jgi:hypothetical protein